MTVLPHARLLVDDVPGVARFYVDHLGFEVAFGELDGEGPYIELQREGVNLGVYDAGLMAQLHGGPAASSGDGFVLVLRVQDVDAWAARLAEAGVDLVAEPADRDGWYLRTVHVRDPAGTLIELNAPTTGHG